MAEKALAESIITKLKAGEDFAALAIQYSKDGSSSKGGDLGWFNAQSMVAPFAAAVAKLEKGAYTLIPVQTQFGWHVIRLDDLRTTQLPTLEQVKDKVKQLVQRKKVTAHLLELRTGSKVDAPALTAALTAYATTPKVPAAAATPATPGAVPAASSSLAQPEVPRGIPAPAPAAP